MSSETMDVNHAVPPAGAHRSHSGPHSSPPLPQPPPGGAGNGGDGPTSSPSRPELSSMSHRLPTGGAGSTRDGRTSSPSRPEPSPMSISPGGPPTPSMPPSALPPSMMLPAGFPMSPLINPVTRPQLSPMPPPIASTTPSMLPLKLDKPVYSSPPPASSNPENNACKLIEYRGAKVAAFSVEGRELICLPQAFELFLKHLVGGLHTVYTKLKRLDIVPIVCNVEQVRVLRGLGAIQPGVNRCKLIAPKEFDVLYEDCTNSSARPGRPPKRNSSMVTSSEALEKLKKSRLDGMDYGYPPPSIIDMKRSPLFGNGYQYPPHMAHLPFMPMGHPAIMNLAMANHLQHAERMMHRHGTTDLTSHREYDQQEEEVKTEHNNNQRSKSDEMDKPLNLEMHSRLNSHRSNRDSVESPVSDVLHNSELDLSTRSSLMNEDADADGAMSDDYREDSVEDDLNTSDVSTSTPGMEQGTWDKLSAPSPHGLQAFTQILNPDAAPTSSVETLLMNIQGLLKVAAENARYREQKVNLEKAELKMEALREREMRDKLAKQIAEVQEKKVFLHKRLRREKKARRHLQQQLENHPNRNPGSVPLMVPTVTHHSSIHMDVSTSHSSASTGAPSVSPHSSASMRISTLTPRIIAPQPSSLATAPPPATGDDESRNTRQHSQENGYSDSEASDENDHSESRHSPTDSERQLSDPHSSSIQTLMETFLQQSSSRPPSCNGTPGHLSSTTVKPIETT